MKFVLYGYTESLMPEEACDIFWDNLAKFGGLAMFLAKNVLEILSPESVGAIESKIFQNVPEPLAKL